MWFPSSEEGLKPSEKVVGYFCLQAQVESGCRCGLALLKQDLQLQAHRGSHPMALDLDSVQTAPILSYHDHSSIVAREQGWRAVALRVEQFWPISFSSSPVCSPHLLL